MPKLRDILAEVGQFLAFTGKTLGQLPSAAYRVSDTGRQLYGALLGTLPVAAVAGAALGVVAWLQIHGLLFQFGSASLLPSALALAVVKGIGPVIAGLVAAGRMGARLGAELASLRVTEQIDALRVLAVPPLRRLVAPRVLACMLALPLLTIVVDYVAILSSYLAEATGGQMTWTEYRLECLRFLTCTDVLAATGKTVIFGLLIGVAGCYCGMRATATTEGVGQAATRAVVLATLLVLLADVGLVRLIQLLSGV